MNEKRDQAFADAFAELRAEYARTLPTEVRELISAVEDARTSRGGPARAMAHKLCGTAGSYGFAEISEIAGRLEVALKVTEGSARPSRAAWAEIDNALKRLRAALAELEGESPGPR